MSLQTFNLLNRQLCDIFRIKILTRGTQRTFLELDNQKISNKFYSFSLYFYFTRKSVHKIKNLKLNEF